MPDWKVEVARLDIADVAQKLGMQVAPGRRSPRVAICPFHDDSAPSLHLYQDDDPHYHCFACHAHGDTVELVKQKRSIDFAEALAWLDSIYRLGLGPAPGARRAAGGDIRQRALTFLRERDDGQSLVVFSQGRGFTPAFLKAAGITAGSMDSFLRSISADRSAAEDAVEAGLAHPAGDDLPAGLRSSQLSPFVQGEALFIPLANLRGKVTGVMSRTLGGAGPKYRFTANFRKSDVLYRSDQVRRQIDAGKSAAALDGAKDRFDLFLVEGVFDALRLEALKLPAVAILGAALSDVQADQIVELAEHALEKGRVLRLHLFLDADKGGRTGLADALPRLLRRASEAEFLVDAVTVDRPEEEKADPDVLLKTMTPEDAVTFVRAHLSPALDALAAISLGIDYAKAPEVITNLDAAGSIMLQNRLARRLQKLDWPKVWRKAEPHRSTLGAGSESAVLARAYARLAEDLTRRGESDAARALPEPFEAATRSANANLLHALVLARESADTREYPVDVASWDRIDEAATAFLPVLSARLLEAAAPRRPYLAHFEAKDSGAPRLKCGPCPEEAIQQQYVLSELLRIRPENREVAEQIPAVRYWADQPSLVVTGEAAPSSAVSFAYQVDMRALEERPDRTRRRDMFRPFIDCWNSFIRHVGGRIERMRCELIYVARLDIKSFYDHVPRHAVARVLDRALPNDETLKTLGIAAQLGNPDQDRRALLIRWLLDHSFGGDARGYAYVDPATGETTYRAGGGAKGLPQGPVLSSYLANIVLFDLDAALDARVRDLDAQAAAEDGSRACGGLYARYVDDIVIAARSPDDLRVLRSAIEAKLEALGLELNEKSEHLAPMTAEDARDWVVERRGAGFVAYGDVDDQPAPATDLRTSWADIPSLDRRTALSVLHWSALDDPEQTPREEFEALIAKVAKADALRPPDMAHIARRVLLRAALDAPDAAMADDERDELAKFLRQFEALIAPLRTVAPAALGRLRAEDRAVAGALAAARQYTAVLAGLERLITGAPESNPTFSLEVRRSIGLAKDRILSWMLERRLLAVLEELLVPPPDRAAVAEQLSAQLQIQRATLEERAARMIRSETGGRSITIAARDRADGPKSPGAAMVQLGWLRSFCPDALESSCADVAGDVDLTLHLIAASAQVEGLRPAARLETLPIASFSRAIATFAEGALSALPGMPGDTGAHIAATFRALAGVAGEESAPFAEALPALLALAAGPGRTEALGRRPYLFQAAVPGAIVLPVPPLPDQPGLFGYDAVTRRIHAVFTTNLDDKIKALPRDLAWLEDEHVGGLPHYVADLPRDLAFLLDPASHRRRVDDDLATIADVFEGLYRRHGPRGTTTAPLIHVFSLIGPVARPAGTPPEGYFSLSWRVPRHEAERLIFERRGDGLALQRSPHAGAELWRIGQSVSDLFSIPHETDDDEDAAGVVGVVGDRRLLQARLKRTAFSRLRGRWIQDAQVTAALATETLPHALDRILKALRETSGDDDGVGPLALEFLLSGRAMRARMRLGSGIEVPGGWARFLETVGARGLRTGDDDGLFAAAELRDGLSRPAGALARAGDTVTLWAHRTDDQRCRQALEATALGFEIAALRSDLRDLTLAILARMTPQGLERLGRVRPDLAAFGGLGPMLLVEPRFGHGQSGGRRGQSDDDDLWGVEAEWQARELFVTLSEALNLRALQGRAALERVSAAGWLTVLSVLSGVMDFDMESLVGESETSLRPAFFPVKDPSAALPLKSLAARLLAIAPGAEPADTVLWPWELAPSLDESGLRAAIAAGRTALDAVGTSAGVVAVLDPRPLRSLIPGEQKAEFYTAEGDHYEIAWWRCSLTAAANERIDRTETLPQGDRRFHPCSMLTDGRSVLLLQVVSECLAKVTDLQGGSRTADQDEPFAKASAEEPPAAPEAAAEPDPDAAPEPDPPLADEAVPAPGPGNGPADAAPPPPQPPPEAPRPPSPDGSGALSAWREHQARSWSLRGEAAGLASTGYGRVAILQYDFVDSYFLEPEPKYSVDGKTLDPDLRVDAAVVDYRLSFEEHRRRQVLTAVLGCCARLGVEALVLPEYSAHPETVSWIEQHCRDRNYAVSVWAGTFRQRPGFALALSDGRYEPVAENFSVTVARPMETHLSVVFRESQAREPINFRSGHITNEAPIFGQTLAEGVRHRQKKYPSIGMGEEFKPSRAPLEPLMAKSRSLRRIESFVSELVCSELFVFNGPLNWRGFAEHLAASSTRYQDDYSVEQWMEVIVEDARQAARMFSGAPGHRPRRSLLFVTCATSRDADYHYFAQSAYLASGVVTAFCNGSSPGITGGSCFVGQGGWETQGVGPAVPNPYHGATPGILSNGEHRGALGRRENALIIADIRPDRTVEDKPRSQALGAPMRLVAHIPIVERQSSSTVPGTWSGSAFRDRRVFWVDPTQAGSKLLDPLQHPELLHDAASQGAVGFDDFLIKMLAVIEATTPLGSTLGLDAKGREKVLAAAVSLGGLFKESEGMAHRAKMLALHHMTHPERLPCPSLLDWLIVDLDVSGFEGYLRHLNATAAAKGGKAVVLSDLPAALRDAPWRWTARREDRAD
ncbi:CHC2 zinc finger domain-containing protein [Caulobacter sp. BE254]|uniref:CHC2 zinc finger domain-containing protein n=1 Tax=Caulobacter sp. BE254 TaxID=2817720 RepID=UPI0028587C68|nr:CHC2 zinc finger domain-containing protein [Caulobacter sp. BE254]MDR7117369.1 hypothetical protein [Caulobacter sp. BE254]